MRLSQKWYLGIVIFIVLLLIVVVLADNYLRCSKKGLNHEEALKIATWKIDQQFIKSQPDIHLLDDHYDLEDGGKIWTFHYISKSCETFIIVDKCGVVDNGGVSARCKIDSH